MTHYLKLKYAHWVTKNILTYMLYYDDHEVVRKWIEGTNPTMLRLIAIRNIMEKQIPAIARAILAASIIGLVVICYFVFK